MLQHPYEPWGISQALFQKSLIAEQALSEVFQKLEAVRAHNQMRVLRAMQDAGVSESAFGGTTGYGYDDLGRDQLERTFAQIMGSEAALVRASITTGTQAIAACLYGCLRPGDELLSLTGAPYDTLADCIGLNEHSSDHPIVDMGSLRDFGISFRQVNMTLDGSLNWSEIETALSSKTKMVFIQRSKGYADRKTLTVDQIERLVTIVRANHPNCIVMVDNCYGEFVEEQEPCMVGADLCAGSLIKNPGGGIAPGGGYIAGRRDLVDKAAARLTAPGLGSHVGATYGLNRLLMQGLFFAPHVVCEALKGMTFAAYMLEKAGYETEPAWSDKRGDIIQKFKFPDAETMIRFCQGVQKSAPVDSFVTPVPAPMPGYDSDVIMAAGAFIQGSSLELSADGPIKAPYMAFMQGGLVYEQVKLATFLAIKDQGDGA